MEIMEDKPFDTRIGVGQVIKGWDEGVPQMSLGEKAKLTITPYRPISCNASNAFAAFFFA
jgi:FKBP-type peptidyl-prolyl cis-trans isomerase 2